VTKTAYAKRLSPEEVAEHTKGMSPEECEEFRIENSTNPLFDMWLRFEGVFGDRAIDQLDISDEDAEVAARRMEVGGTESGRAFAYLLRSIANRRRLRVLSHKVSAVWAASGKSEAMSIPEIHERYEKLPKGDA
jgi:hypothetical protein